MIVGLNYLNMQKSKKQFKLFPCIYGKVDDCWSHRIKYMNRKL